ncbi:porin [uncultured Tateyamaria sp.]|uniref:porin n=1 Tax=uncultured Tateyamaria sp. TaxID=455651 RepID=UPI00262178AD|nr:porin [uncultured Tateyamaria sp.]
MRNILLTCLIGLATSTLGPTLAYAQVVNIEDGGFKFTFGGQINRGVLFTDDGVESNEFWVDNDNSSTRLRSSISYDFGNYVIGGNVEYEFEFSSSNVISQLNSDVGSSVSNERKFEVFTQTPYGTFTYGQGDAASNGIAEIDTSGTFIGNHSAVGLIAGGQILRTATDDFSSNDIGDFFSNFDGITRIERFRYDTPTFGGGFVASASIGEDDQNDIVLRYTGKMGDFRIRGGITFAELDDTDRIAGSVSAFHEPTGLNVTFASAQDDLDVEGRDDPGYYYLKLGYQQKELLPWGSTSFAFDYYDGSDQNVNGSDSESFSLFVVQKVDKWNTEFYAGYRTYEVSTPAEDFQDTDVVFIGSRFTF